MVISSDKIDGKPKQRDELRYSMYDIAYYCGMDILLINIY